MCRVYTKRWDDAYHDVLCTHVEHFMTMLHSDLVNAEDFMITEWERGCFCVHILGLAMAMIYDSYHSNQQPNLIQAHLHVLYIM